MRLISSLSVCLLLAIGLSTACDDVENPNMVPVQSSGIVNGQLEDGFPSTVSLGGSFMGGSPSSMCTGNLITPRVVVSAAHCGDGIPIELVQSFGSAYFGSNIESAEDEIGFDNLIIHPDYVPLDSEPGGDTGEFDLSVFVLSDEASVEPTWFRRDPMTDDDLGVEMTSVGFGITGPDSGGSGIKRSAILTLDIYDENTLLSGSSTNPDYAQICSGDSGGPQFVFRDGYWEQWSVHSWGDPECAVKSGSTRVDIAVEWILDQVEAVHDSRNICLINGWYENGVCDEFCDIPDPECDPDAGTDTDSETGGDGDGGATDDQPTSSGCGCSTTGGSSGAGASILALLGALLFLRRR